MKSIPQHLLSIFDPAAETIHGLQTWPDSALTRLARELAKELNCRQLATFDASPTAQTFAAIAATMTNV